MAQVRHQEPARSRRGHLDADQRGERRAVAPVSGRWPNVPEGARVRGTRDTQRLK
ncbi:Hypothetical protein CAP_3759 [Chondromyces apiculatus DSM 436]|uniref:Uncharacterized protein n=1 Tax=Chondromyces apiculatus DSM 436 TaxID=1192034 RepID=A0A017T6R1_9BACT|nr:Hypothetical protein CAP_3759 [Chondromyces apiculatus DSM 436]